MARELTEIIFKKPIDGKALSRVSLRSELRDVYLLDANVISDPSTRDPLGSELEYIIKTDLMNIEKNTFNIMVGFKITATHKKRSNNPIMIIEANFMLVYSFGKDNLPPKEEIEDFAKIKAVDSAWPYWREFVQNLTARMGFPTLTIPVLSFKIKDADKTAKSKPPKSEPAKSKNVKEIVS